MMSSSGGDDVDMMKNGVNASDVDMMAVGEKYDITVREHGEERTRYFHRSGNVCGGFFLYYVLSA